MIVLDTDHLTVLQGRGASSLALANRLAKATDRRFCTTVVTFEEHMRGWLAFLRKARDIEQETQPYDRLIALVRFFQAWEILRFDQSAAARFREYRQRRIRIGTLDLKIACIAMVNDATLLTANHRDFGQVHGLRIENWLG